MATTSNTYTGNGSNKLFSITFPYLDTSDIDVYLNGTLQTITTQYTFANATTVEFVAAPANGAVILLDRSTDDSALQATFFPGSSIKASDLNDDFDQVLYIAQETSNEATTATTTAATATTTANTALSQSAAAVSTANTASSNASAAVSTANTASTNASNAVTTANTASSNATTAVNTANAATSTANTASSNASAAVSTANTASSNASAAVSTANTASSNASAAVSTANAANSTANTASGNASTAVTTANNAVTTANTANSNSNTAVTTANAAAAAVANAVLYTTVANVAAIPGSPANNAAVEVTNSTGIESFTPLSGLPAGFIGSSGLSVRIIYQTSGATWTWIQYFPNDPEDRYLKLAGGTLTGTLAHPLGADATPSITFTGDTNTGIYSPAADQLAVATAGTGRLFVNSSGRVGVGGTPSTTFFHVYTDSPTTTSAPTICLEGGTNGYGAGVEFASRTSAGGTLVAMAKITADGEAPWNTTASTQDANLRFFTAADGSLSERLRIDSSGRVGIGVSAPSYQLDLGGGTTVNTRIQIARGSDDSNAMRIGYNTIDLYRNVSLSSAQNSLAINQVGSDGTRNVFQIDSSGNVGIGTSSVASTLHIVDSSNAGNGTIRLGGGPAFPGYNSTIQQDGQTTGKLLFNSAATAGTGHGHQFQVDGTAAVTIDASRRVGIGTTSPQLSFVCSNGGANGFEIDPTQSTGTITGINSYNRSSSAFTPLRFNASEHRWDTASTERARIDSSGRLLVGTSTSLGAGDGQHSLLQIRGNESNLSTGAFISLSRGAAPTATGQTLGQIIFTDNGGGIYSTILCESDGTPGVNDFPGRIVLATTADGASSPTERMRIRNGGEIDMTSSDHVLSAITSVAAGTVKYLYRGTHSSSTISFNVWSNGNVQNTNNSYGPSPTSS
jgi:hypothetical protein